jgi:membrane protease YdiL (CAAX protease family)
VIVAFLALALACQVFVHQRLHGWAMAVAYPIGAGALLVAIVWLLRRYQPEPVPTDRPSRPRLELALAGLCVAIHFVWLLPQAPGLEDNPVSAVVVGAAASFPGWARPLLLCVALPCLLLVPLRPRATAFGLRGARWQLLAGLLLLYAPLLLLSGASPSPAGALSYFIGAALPEESLFRGALHERVEPLTRDPMHAVVITALAFGFMHLPINAADHGWLLGAAYCVGQNGFGGLLGGLVYQRTRSLPLLVVWHWWSGVALGAA